LLNQPAHAKANWQHTTQCLYAGIVCSQSAFPPNSAGSWPGSHCGVPFVCRNSCRENKNTSGTQNCRKGHLAHLPADHPSQRYIYIMGLIRAAARASPQIQSCHIRTLCKVSPRGLLPLQPHVCSLSCFLRIRTPNTPGCGAKNPARLHKACFAQINKAIDICSRSNCSMAINILCMRYSLRSDKARATGVWRKSF